MILHIQTLCGLVIALNLAQQGKADAVIGQNQPFQQILECLASNSHCPTTQADLLNEFIQLSEKVSDRNSNLDILSFTTYLIPAQEIDENSTAFSLTFESQAYSFNDFPFFPLDTKSQTDFSEGFSKISPQRALPVRAP